MNISEIVQSSGWKNFMAKLYGLGASIVIVGALFKIMHWPGAGLMLTIGLLTEAVIFFFSAFEPLHEELDWTLVYPELAGMTDPDEVESFKERGKAGHTTLEKFEDLVGSANISGDTFAKLGESLNKLNTITTNMSDLSGATVATESYVDNVKTAAESAGKLSHTFNQSSDSLNQYVGVLTNSYAQLASSVQQDVDAVSNGTRSYGQQLESMNKNLSALNAAYELQLKGTSEHLKDTQGVYQGFDQLVVNLKSSVEETQKYREEIAKLGNSLASLNTIYGNMLSAMKA
jgi:gliding motility-associated protein GldL